MKQPVQLLFIVSLLIGIFYNGYYRARKQTQYKNDERWNMIQVEARKIGYLYFEALIVVFSVIIGYLVFRPSSYQIPLQKVCFYGFGIIIIGQLVELVALKHFDKNM